MHQNNEMNYPSGADHPSEEDLAAVVERISRLGRAGYTEFLARTAGRLALLGRDSYTERGHSGEVAYSRLKACNEVLEALATGLGDFGQSVAGDEHPTRDSIALMINKLIYRASRGGLGQSMLKEILEALRATERSGPCGSAGNGSVSQ